MATIILKATERCNSSCLYCDVVHKPQAAQQTMSLAVLEQVFLRANEFLEAHPAERLELVWHGGEPLLLGPEWFEEALAFQRRHCAQTAERIEHGIQTNLSLFSVEFARLFRELGIDGIGTSYDPIAGIRGPGKVPDTATYNRRFLEGLDILEREGFGWGVIYVVTKLTLPRAREIFHFMTNLKADGGIDFHPVLVYGPEPRHLAITPEEYADFLGEILPLWWENRQRYGGIEPFSSTLRNLQEGRGSALGCVDSGACAASHWNVAPDGSLSHCGRSADWKLLDYGSIFDKSLAESRADPQRDVFRQRDRELEHGECADCRFWQLCHGGCPLDAWADRGSFMHKTPWCAAKKLFIEKHFEPLTGLRFGSPTRERSDT